MENLELEISENSKKVHAAEMKMSIGEITNLYRDNEIIIRPEFQRLFRWGIAQKSRFIESILIGIPIPPIFVQQKENGVWEIIDGLQRISTILQFVGLLEDEHKNIINAEPLIKTKFLSSLEGIYFKHFESISESKDNCFSKEIQLIFKRVPLGVEIIKRESDSTTKYELFDRLNSGGSSLTEQEIRNAIFLTEKPFAIKLIDKLSKENNFRNTTTLSDKDTNGAYDKELILRFFAYVQIPDKFKEYGGSVKEFLDGYLNDHIKEDELNILENEFNDFFNFIHDNFEENSFRTRKNDKYIKGFKISKYEALVIGLKDQFDKLDDNKALFIKKIQNLETQDWFRDAVDKKSYARRRIQIFLDKAIEYFRL
jgi:uncharacterized protein with ParB-like and HNH nuclease domain